MSTDRGHFCPECGSDFVRELRRITEVATVSAWDENNEPTAWSDTEIFHDTCETIGYDCGDCGAEFDAPAAVAPAAPDCNRAEIGVPW